MNWPVDGLRDETQRAIELFLDDWRVEADIPGVAVAVVDTAGTIFATGLGASDIEAREPATPETRFPYASTTKVITGLTVLQFIERGAFALDDPIRAYVDTWSDAPGDPITIRDLLTHSTGLPTTEDGPRNYLFSGEPPVSPIVTRDDKRRHLDGMAGQRIVDEERFMYSDTNYTLLGEIIEAVDDRTFAAVVEEDVFEPLGMDRAMLGYGELSDLDDTATGYSIEEDTPSARSFDLETDTSGLGPAAAAGALASPMEMGRFVRCLLNGGELDGTRVLDAELVEAMCTHQGPTLEHVDGTPRGIGYGPRITEFGQELLVEHSGTAPGIGRAYLGLLPEPGIGVTLWVNTPDVPVEALGGGVLALVGDRDPVAAVPYLSVREKVRDVVGRYESHHGSTVVRVEPAASEAYIEVSNESGGGWSFPAFPDSLEHDEYSFTTVWPAGLEQSLDFVDTTDGMELRLSAYRLWRTNLE